MAKGYIYTISCPKTKKVAYVGMSNNPKFRFIQHSDSESNIGKWIRAMNSIGLIPVLDIIDFVSTGIKQLETEYIIKFSMCGEAFHNVKQNAFSHPCKTKSTIYNKADNCYEVRDRKKATLNKIYDMLYDRDHISDMLPEYAINKIYNLLTNEPLINY